MLSRITAALRRPRPGPVMAAAVGVWTLLFGMLLLMLGNGLQGTLLGVRAAGEGFSTQATGIVMAGYFAGFLGGSKLAPRLLRSAGHLRVFAALAALASVSILLHSLVVDPWAWGLLRLVSGFAFAGIYIVAESWLNDRVSNEHRGGLLSIYMVVSYAGLTGGQLLLNLADPAVHDLFMTVAILISLASVPILLVAGPAPTLGEWEALGPRRLYRMCHLGAIGAVVAGVTGGALLGMAPVFAAAIGLSVTEISLFMTLVMAAGALAQYPVGKLSDRFDRRRVIAVAGGCGTAGAATAAVASIVFSEPAGVVLIAAGTVVGAASLTLYPLISAHTNDFLAPDQRVGAGSSLIMLFGIGAVIGPPATGEAMAQLGPSGFFWFLFVVLALFTAYTVWRAHRLGPLDVSGQTRWVLTPLRTPALVPGWIRAQTERLRRQDPARRPREE